MSVMMTAITAVGRGVFVWPAWCLWKGGLLLLVLFGIAGNILVTTLPNYEPDWHKLHWICVGMGINALIFMGLLKFQRRLKKHVI